MSTLPGFRRVLVANRGEIAVRVIRAVQESGAQAIAVYSDADHGAMHVRLADAAVRLGPAEPAQSYLDQARVIDAARASGAEAIHPGYGFLSENAEFVRAVEAAGLVFIGPTAEAMEALGSKRRAKETAAAAGVPCVPGFDAREQRASDDDELERAAARLGFPLLVKASAGGGGRGMRLVERAADFRAALEAGRREAVQAFGDGTMLLEKYVHPARHIEVQVLGDGTGHAIALGERECSVQRRHQKVLEESPSPLVDAALRARLEGAAVALASAVRYRNAGTVEFLASDSGEFWFLEVNTRLQVEHPVTELVAGVDLVALQLALAAGASLEDLALEARAPRGHALEARICAEDPEHDFLPAAGRLEVCALASGPGVRIDNGFEAGDEVPIHYDSLLCKVIVHAPSRAASVRRMERVLARSAWLGLPTNVDFLLRVLGHPDFRAGRLRTDFLAAHPEVLAEPASPPASVLQAAALARCFGRSRPQASAASAVAAERRSPWQDADGFRVGTGHASGRP